MCRKCRDLGTHHDVHAGPRPRPAELPVRAGGAQRAARRGQRAGGGPGAARAKKMQEAGACTPSAMHTMVYTSRRAKLRRRRRRRRRAGARAVHGQRRSRARGNLGRGAPRPTLRKVSASSRCRANPSVWERNTKNVTFFRAGLPRALFAFLAPHSLPHALQARRRFATGSSTARSSIL